VNSAFAQELIGRLRIARLAVDDVLLQWLALRSAWRLDAGVAFETRGCTSLP